MSLDQFSSVLENAGEALGDTYASGVEMLGEYSTLAFGVTAAVGAGAALTWALNRKYNQAQTPSNTSVSTGASALEQDNGKMQDSTENSSGKKEAVQEDQEDQEDQADQAEVVSSVGQSGSRNQEGDPSSLRSRPCRTMTSYQ